MTFVKALNRCSHCKQTSRCCCLCYFQNVQQYPASVTVVNNPSVLLYNMNECSSCLPDFKSLMNDFASIGGNKQLKQYLTEFIINPSLHQDVLFCL